MGPGSFSVHLHSRTKNHTTRRCPACTHFSHLKSHPTEPFHCLDSQNLGADGAHGPRAIHPELGACCFPLVGDQIRRPPGDRRQIAFPAHPFYIFYIAYILYISFISLISYISFISLLDIFIYFISFISLILSTSQTLLFFSGGNDTSYLGHF